MEVKLAISMIYAAIENEDLTVLSIKTNILWSLMTSAADSYVCKKLKVCVRTDSLYFGLIINLWL